MLDSQALRYIHGQKNRPIRVYHKIDVGFILEDFFSKVKFSYS